MSEIEHNIGKLIPIEMQSTLEMTAKKILSDKGQVPDTSYDSCIEQLEDEFYCEYITIKDVIYKIESEEIDHYNEILRASRNNDGSINFEVRFHNGGCGLNEAIGEAIGGIKELDQELDQEVDRSSIDDMAINIIVDDEDSTLAVFVEVENDKGESIRIGERTETPEGYAKIRISVLDIINHIEI